MQRAARRAIAALLLVVTAAESLAAVAPGSPVRVTTTGGSGVSADRFEGRLVSAADPLTLVTSFSGDTLRVGYDEIAKLEVGTPAKARRSLAGTLVGAVLIGGITTLVAFYHALDEYSIFSRSRYGMEMFVGISAAGVIAGGYVGGLVGSSPPSGALEWREVRKRELLGSD